MATLVGLDVIIKALNLSWSLWNKAISRQPTRYIGQPQFAAVWAFLPINEWWKFLQRKQPQKCWCRTPTQGTLPSGYSESVFCLYWPQGCGYFQTPVSWWRLISYHQHSVNITFNLWCLCTHTYVWANKANKVGGVGPRIMSCPYFYWGTLSYQAVSRPFCEQSHSLDSEHC